jgi:L-threonylcarbamoyladenylate synthase
MRYTKIDAKKPDPKIITDAVRILKNGGIIVYPTDTVYGLGVDVFNQKAVEKLFLIKQRDMRRPISLMVQDLNQIESLLGKLPDNLMEILKKLVPGKSTALLANTLIKPIPIFKYFSENDVPLKKIGFRIPDHPVTNELSATFGKPISTTSANLSGKKANANVKDIIAAFGDKLDLILDAEKLPRSKPSTVVDFTKNPYLVTREGAISMMKLSRMLPDVEFKKVQEHFTVTFVCSGNICRSPMAEAIMKKKILRTKYRDIIKVQSSGTLELSPTRAHYLAMMVSEENNIDLEKHISMMISEKIVEDSNIIFAMALNHYNYLREHFPQIKDKIFMLKQWKNKKRLFVPSIADPIGHDQEFFQNTFSEIHTEINRVMPFIFQEVRKFIKYNDLEVEK